MFSWNNYFFMYPDLKLKEIAESIARKEYAKSKSEGREGQLFDLEIAEAKDMFEARCMVLLGAALESGDYMERIHYFELLEASAPAELIHGVYANLFKRLVQDVLSKTGEECEKTIVKRLRVFDDSSEE